VSDLLLESALRSLALGVAVWLGLVFLRVRNPRAHMTAWTVVLVASLAMPVLMHRLTVNIPAAAPPLRVVESLSSILSGPLSEQVEIPVLPAQGPPALPPAAEPSTVQPPSQSGTKESLVRFIDSMQRGQPNYDEMSPELAAANRSQVSWSGPLMKSLGPLHSITFRTVNAQGWDVYDAAFEKGGVEFSIAPLTSDGKVTARAWNILSGAEAVSPAQRTMQECQARYKFDASHMWVGRWPFVEACFKEKTGLYPGQVPVDRRRLGWSGFDRRTLATAIYLVVAGVMLLRLLTGLLLSFRMARAARRIDEGWTGGADVRVSDAVGTPVTFGSTVLLPAEYADWGEEKRQIVLSHERAHIAHGDFYVLLLAAFNRAVFWFNPLAWWQLVRMAELAEIISDDTVLEKLDDRPSYAGILVDLALHKATVTVAMARACTLRKRVERILAGTAVPARMGWRKRGMVAIALAPAVMFSAAAVVPGASKPSAESVAARPGASPPYADTVEREPHPFDRYVGYYEFDPSRAVAVTRARDRVILHETGRLKFEATAYGDSEFVSRDTDETVTFTSDAEGRTTALLLGESGMILRRAVRIDAERAQKIENAFARQVATAPDRYKDQLPEDGSEAAVLWAIDDLQRGAPSYRRMSKPFADIVRRQIAQLHAMLTALGAVESVFFRGVGPGGWDIYGAKFARGLAEFRVRLASDGNIDGMFFRPDGDSTPGEILTCTQEQTLKAVPDTVPIRLLLYNESGADIRAFALDGDGRRSRDVKIGDDRSAPFLTHVGQPWVVTDASGQCLEIIMPGQTTRFLIIRADAHEQAGRPAPQRTTPMSGSQQALRRYIGALGRGEPNYEDMTPEIARYTRQNLVLNQAILARLGALRAMLFRAATVYGEDIYFVHFANGSAEWRIGLVKQGKIGRIALAP
jgi:BlaR1 peptidase M56